MMGSSKGQGGGQDCPICGKPAIPEHRPFCSGRCRDVDLNRWLGEVYRVPGPPADEDDDQPPPS